MSGQNDPTGNAQMNKLKIKNEEWKIEQSAARTT
jgi:hypothetical protein